MSHMNDDPRLTAYALGDLDDAERAELEREIEDSPELQSEVEAIRNTAASLSAAFASEAVPQFAELSALELSAVTPSSPLTTSRPRRLLSLKVLALAASLAVAVILWYVPHAARERTRQAARSHLKQLGISSHAYHDTFGDAVLRYSLQDRNGSASTLEDLYHQSGAATAPAATPIDDKKDASLSASPPFETKTRSVNRIVGGDATPHSEATPPSAQSPQDKLDSTTTPVFSGEFLIIAGGSAAPAVGKQLGQDVEKAEWQYQSGGVAAPNMGGQTPGEPAQSLYSPAPPTPLAPRGGMGMGNGGGQFGTQSLDGVNGSINSQGDNPWDADVSIALSGLSSVPVGEEPPIVYPPAEVWSRLTERRRERQELSPGTEDYNTIIENPFRRVTDEPLSTFSIDVDTASYANMRRFLDQNTLPPRAAVRIEELVNYFPYDYAQPTGEDPFAVHVEVAGCPWNPRHRLARVALKGREIDADRRPPSNLVFLVDVSGSMRPDNKLPLVKQGLRMLVARLREDDRVAIVTYAGNSGVALASTGGEQRSIILEAIDRLESGGSTNGASGIELAYALAVGHFVRGGTNRVILATDGDFNVGVTDRGQLTRLIEEKARSGVFLSVLGFGMGNLKDSTLETLADKGNGQYAYIDGEREAHKVLVEELSGTLVTIAKDVKLQVEFNPAQVAGFRLLGYENRVLAHQDFNNDQKDAGDIGAGHTVTAFYEIVPVGVAGEKVGPTGEPLKYQAVPQSERKSERPDGDVSPELLTVKLRYKQPDGVTSKLLEVPVTDGGNPLTNASGEFRFAASVVQFGLLLRDSSFRCNANLGSVLTEAQATVGEDPEGHRREFVRLVRQTCQITGQPEELPRP